VIDGVAVRRLNPHEDKRGELVELYRIGWEVHPDPFVYSYMINGALITIPSNVIHAPTAASFSGLYAKVLQHSRRRMKRLRGL
jgi:hypothetical protein